LGNGCKGLQCRQHLNWVSQPNNQQRRVRRVAVLPKRIRVCEQLPRLSIMPSTSNPNCNEARIDRRKLRTHHRYHAKTVSTAHPVGHRRQGSRAETPRSLGFRCGDLSIMLFIASSLQAHQLLARRVRLRQQPRVRSNYPSMDDSRNQQLRVYTNALEFATAVDGGVDSYFSFRQRSMCGSELRG